MSKLMHTAACLLTAAAAAQAQPLVLEKHTVRDPMVNNIEAVKFLKPKGWKVEGGVKWYPNLSHQTCFEVKVSNPDGAEQFETFPFALGAWITNPIMPMQRGSNYMGNVILEPIDEPAEVIRRLTLPEFRGRLRPRITGTTEMPEVAKALSQANGGVRVRSQKVRVEYELDGKMMEEDFYLSIFSVTADIGGASRSTIWGPAWTPFSLRAEKGKLDAATPLMLAMANSATLDATWFGAYKYVCDLFMKRMNQNIMDAKRLSDIIARNSEEIRQMYSDAYKARSESQDRMSRNFSNYIRGVEQYTSPFESHPVQLPSDYKYAWTSAQGSYVLSNDAGFNPNVGSMTDWRLMKVAK